MPVSYEIETLTTGMIANQQRHDVVSNNLANVNSVGFKKDVSVHRSFAEVLGTESMKAPKRKEHITDQIYRTNCSVDMPLMTQEIKTAHQQGDLQVTENTFDLALMGKGFFSVQTEQGVEYTRNGAFMLNSKNEVVNARGERILAEGGANGEGVPLVVTGSNVVFQDDGTVQVDGVAVGKLKMVDFADYNNLVKVGKSNYEYQGNAADITSAEADVAQGYLEGSNVNSITEMTSMMSNMRQYELAGREMKSIEQTFNRAIVELSKFR